MQYWTLSHSFNVDAAHCLSQLPKDHKCHNMHGHTWKFVVQVRTSQLNKESFVIDFHKIKAICKEAIHDRLDHQVMNDQLGFVPTCELLAQWAYKTLTNYFQPALTGDVWLWCVTVVENIEAGNSVTYSEMGI